MIIRILAWKLRLLARLYLWRYRPVIIAITGSVGKTTTKEAVTAVLRTRYTVRSTEGNLNNELGVPLTVIGDFAEEYYRVGGTFGFWALVFWRGFVGLFFSRIPYPAILVLEFGADHPGDIARLTAEYPPHLAVVTHVGDVPAHVEFYASPRAVAQEKAAIVGRLMPDDVAVLGCDDLSVLEMRSRTKGRERTFGFSEGADVRVTAFRTCLEGSRPLGIAFDLEVHGHSMPVMIGGALGSGLAQAAAAAVAVAGAMDISLVDAVQAIARMTPPAGRMRILEGIRNTTIIDDAYNASPVATRVAIDAVRGIPAARHVLVLGDMLELGSYSVRAHQALGALAAEIADVLVCVGEQGRIIADAAANQMHADHIHRASDAHEAAAIVQQLIREGDLILIKGSQGMRMERIVQEIMLRPEQSPQLLVRQSARWLAK